jgi:major membrane immunogen (membrane-anchored lipoprotein)
MKTKSLLLLLVLCSMLVFGCGFSDDEDRGKPPKITKVHFYSDASPIPASNFNVGDTISFEVKFQDPDGDAFTLHVVIYDLGKPDEVFDGPTVYELNSEQQSENSVSEILDAAFTAGEYRVDFQLVDEKGNLSLIFRKKLFVA